MHAGDGVEVAPCDRDGLPAFHAAEIGREPRSDDIERHILRHAEPIGVRRDACVGGRTAAVCRDQRDLGRIAGVRLVVAAAQEIRSRLRPTRIELGAVLVVVVRVGVSDELADIAAHAVQAEPVERLVADRAWEAGPRGAVETVREIEDGVRSGIERGVRSPAVRALPLGLGGEARPARGDEVLGLPLLQPVNGERRSADLVRGWRGIPRPRDPRDPLGLRDLGAADVEVAQLDGVRGGRFRRADRAVGGLHATHLKRAAGDEHEFDRLAVEAAAVGIHAPRKTRCLDRGAHRGVGDDLRVGRLLEHGGPRRCLRRGVGERTLERVGARRGLDDDIGGADIARGRDHRERGLADGEDRGGAVADDDLVHRPEVAAVDHDFRAAPARAARRRDRLDDGPLHAGLAPVDEQRRKIASVDDAVVIDVGRAPGACPPLHEHLGEVRAVHHAAAVEIRVAGGLGAGRCGKRERSARGRDGHECARAAANTNSGDILHLGTPEALRHEGLGPPVLEDRKSPVAARWSVGKCARMTRRAPRRRLSRGASACQNANGRDPEGPPVREEDDDGCWRSPAFHAPGRVLRAGCVRLVPSGTVLATPPDAVAHGEGDAFRERHRNRARRPRLS